jgi:hypothetical protein
LELTDTRTRQTQHHVKGMIKYLRWDQTVGGDIVTTLDNIQLASGFVSPLLEVTDKKIDYIDIGWILELRQRLDEMGATMWIEHAWQPQLQREGDLGLMEQFLQVHSTPKQCRQLRQVLHWLRVITLADLVDPSGKFIPEGTLTGEWRAQSTLEWPKQPKPDDAAFATFRKVLRNTIFFNTSPWHRPSAAMYLPTPLGRWYDTTRHIIPSTACLGDSIFVTEESEEEKIVMRFQRHRDTGFFDFAGSVDQVPANAQPIHCQFRSLQALSCTIL